MEIQNHIELEHLLQSISSPVRVILVKALNEQEINATEALTLFAAQGADLLGLICTADMIRHRQVGDKVTYVKVRNINFTNVCYTNACYTRDTAACSCLTLAIQSPTFWASSVMFSSWKASLALSK